MHLFAGVGGGLLCDLILGHKPVVAVEWDSYACRILRERAAEGWFPGLHVWEGDVRLFDPSEYAGKVDCIHAGFPCQDISVAGKQAGVSEGTRSGLYREVLRIADAVRPKELFLENVAAIVSNGLGTVLGDLAAMGYDSRWLCIRASDVGAPHHRDRWFLLANARHSQFCERGQSSDVVENVRDSLGVCGDGVSSSCWKESNVLAYSNCNYRRSSGMEQNPRTDGRDVASRSGEILADAYGAQRQGVQRQERIPTEYSNFSSSSWWETEPELGRVADGISNRVGQLKGYGNAQVPLQAAAAYRLLKG